MHPRLPTIGEVADFAFLFRHPLCDTVHQLSTIKQGNCHKRPHGKICLNHIVANQFDYCSNKHFDYHLFPNLKLSGKPDNKIRFT